MFNLETFLLANLEGLTRNFSGQLECLFINPYLNNNYMDTVAILAYLNFSKNQARDIALRETLRHLSQQVDVYWCVMVCGQKGFCQPTFNGAIFS